MALMSLKIAATETKLRYDQSWKSIGNNAKEIKVINSPTSRIRFEQCCGKVAWGQTGFQSDFPFTWRAPTGLSDWGPFWIVTLSPTKAQV